MSEYYKCITCKWWRDPKNNTGEDCGYKNGLEITGLTAQYVGCEHWDKCEDKKIEYLGTLLTDLNNECCSKENRYKINEIIDYINKESK